MIYTFPRHKLNFNHRAAVLLIIPGLLTDAAGLLLLLPPSRHWLAWLLARRLEQRFATSQATQTTLEGEYRREGDEISLSKTE